MKIYVICDLEGTAGVVDHRRQCWFDGQYYGQARRLATLELNALVEGAVAGGATEVWAWDGHGSFPGGIDVELLHPACRLVMGAGDGGPQGFDATFDGAFLLGFHAMAGTGRAVLAHSFFGNVGECRLNEKPIGEIAMNLLTVGAVGIPCLFIAGDQAAVEEARALVPEIEGVAVKTGLSQSPVNVMMQAPMCSFAPEKAREVIREGARRAMGKIGQIEPLRMEPPYVARVRFTDEKFAESSAKQPGVKRIDSLTVEKTGDALDGILPL